MGKINRVRGLGTRLWVLRHDCLPGVLKEEVVRVGLSSRWWDDGIN